MILSMRFARNDSPPPAEDRGAEVRRTGRLRCDMLSCTFGDAVDLSATGMRVRHKGSLRITADDSVSLTLAFAAAEVRLDARVVWIRRTGFRRHEIGFEFIDVSPEARECLHEIARCATRLASFRPEAA